MSKKEASSKVDDLTSAIREMASRVNSEFVPDENKTRNYIAAAEKREREKRQSTDSQVDPNVRPFGL
jgi:hypothetical protein